MTQPVKAMIMTVTIIGVGIQKDELSIGDDRDVAIVLAIKL